MRRILLNLFKLPRYIFYFLKALFVFRNSFSLIYYYIKGTSPPHKVIELRSGLKIFLSDHKSDIITVFVIIIKEDYGKIKPGTIVVDIGANIGVYSLYATSLGAKKVYAYEPNKNAYKVLLQNITNNDLEDVIIPQNMAISDINNKTVKIPSSSSPYNQIIANNNDNIENYDLISTINVESIISNNKIEFIDVLKIDCEGCEYSVFFNMKKSTMLKIGNIRMEYHSGPNKRLFSYLKTNNFDIICIKKDSSCLHAQLQSK